MKWRPILAVPLLILVLGVWLLWPSAKPQAGWYNDNWFYRKKITVTNNTTAENNKYVTLSSFDTSDTTRFQGDCGDVRFSKKDGELLPYYIVSGCGTSSTTFHILFDTLPADAQDIYIYYGNPTVTNGFESADFSSAATNATAGTPASEEKSPGPVASLSFDEGFGTSTKDATANNNNGTINNAVWKQDSDCISGKCLYFDGTGDYVSVADANSLDIANTITISAWVKPTIINGVRQDIVTKSSAFEFRIHTDNTFRVKLFGLTDDFLSGTMATLVPGEWVHLAATYDGANIKAYVNGKLVQTDDSSGTITTNSSVMLVGSETTTTFPFKGFIDEVRVYPYARSDSEIAADYVSRGNVKGVSAQFGAGGPGSGEKLSQGLMGYWKMDESSWNGTTGEVIDSSGNNNNGTSANSTSTGTGKFGYGGIFDGTDDYVNIAHNTNLDLNQRASMTVSSWIKTTYAPSGNGYIYSKFSFSNGFVGLGFISSGVPFAYFRGPDGSSGVNGVSFGTGSINNGSWHHIVATYNDSTGDFAGYIDGQLVKSSVISTRLNANIDNTSSSVIANRDAGAAQGIISGTIDEVRVYSRALSPSEVSALYNFAPGPVGYWNFDEKAGLAANDLSGNGNSGTLTLGPTWIQGKYGGALSFDGSDDYVDAGDPSSGIFDVNATQSFSISLWVNGATKAFPEDIMIKGGAPGWRVRTSSNDGHIFCQFRDGTFSPQAETQVAALDNTWHHISCVRDVNADVIRIYLDGILQQTTTDTTTGSAETATNLKFPNSATTFLGLLDDIRIYNYARTPSQIIEDMNGSHPLGGSPVGSQVGYWKFDEGYGTTAYDQSMNRNDLTLSAARWTNNGKFGKAWDGSNFSVTRADDSDFDFVATEDFTLSLWLKSDAVSNPSAIEYFLNKSSAAASGYGIYGTSTGQAVFAIDDDTTWTPDDVVQSATVVYDGTWHYVAARKTGAASIDLFVDGKLEASKTTLGATGSLTNSVALFIGGRDASNNLYKGDIDEVKIYRGALTDEQIKLDYNQGQATVMGAKSTASDGKTADNSSSREYCVPGDTSSCSSPLGEWKFNEKGGTTANDTSGNGYSATIFNNINFDADDGWKQGKMGGSFQFDGTNDNVQVSNTAFSLVGSGNFTVETWVKADSLSTSNARIIAYQQDASNGYHIAIIASGDGTCASRFIFEVDKAASYSAAGCSSSNTAIVRNRWYHVVGTFDGSTNTALIYVDGVLQVSGTAKNLGLGAASRVTFASQSTAGTNVFDGSLDEAKIYNYLRTPAQIAWDYNLGNPIVNYQFDECQGTTAYNNVLNGNNTSAGNDGTITIGATGSNASAGTCTGAATEAWKNGANGKFGSSLSFDGTDDFITTASFAPLAGVGSTGPTVSWGGWFYPKITAVSRTFIEKASEVRLQTDSNSKPICDIYTGGAFTGNSASSTNSALILNTWNHLVCTYDGTTIKLYLNGKQIDSWAQSGNIIAASSILYMAENSSGAQRYPGQIDDVRIYNYSLNQTQVNTLYNRGAAVNFAPITASP